MDRALVTHLRGIFRKMRHEAFSCWPAELCFRSVIAPTRFQLKHDDIGLAGHVARKYLKRRRRFSKKLVTVYQTITGGRRSRPGSA